MKNTLLFLILLLSGMAGAQIVNIPDPAFKNALLQISLSSNDTAQNSAGYYIIVDSNGDGEIQVSEAQAVWRLSMRQTNVTSMTGIEAFTNLRGLNIGSMNNLTELDLTALVNLENLDMDLLHNLEELNIQNLSNLQTINIDLAALTTLNCTGLDSLEGLTLNADTVTSLNCSGLASLKNLNMHSCFSLSSLTMSNNPVLESVTLLSASSLHSFDCSGLPSLKYLWLNGAYNLTSLTMGNHPNLTGLFLEDIGDVESLDLSGCTALTQLTLTYEGYSDITRFLNLKNGIAEYDNLYFALSAEYDYPLYICIDEGNEALLGNNLANPYIQISTYCSFTPGGDYNTIAGNFTFDSDSNGCDGNDAYTGFVRVNMDNGIEELSTFTTSGHYNFYTQAGTYTLTPQLENDWFTITPATATITQATVDNSTTTQNFCIAANGVHPDVEVVVIPLWNAQPGFDTDYMIVYKNKGNQTLSGAVTLNYDDTVLDYVEAYPAVSSSATGLLTWNYANLLPFETRSIFVNMNLNGPLEIPAVNLGDVLTFSVLVTPTTGDETPADNTFTLNQIVTGSFDPNDITCLEGESVSPEKIGDYLHYNINFENTGTAPATFIVVKDTIDQTKFDISSIQLMYASHPIETRINGNKVEFIFDNINLGPEEKGNVTFKIKTLNTLQVNDDVTQQANIFFDYNWPIQTNEATTTFELLGRGDFAMDNSVKVYPNPAKGIVTVSADSNVKSVQLYDIQGRLLQSGTVNDIDTTIDLTSRNSGMYFVKVITDKGIKVEKIVKQ